MDGRRRSRKQLADAESLRSAFGKRRGPNLWSELQHIVFQVARESGSITAPLDKGALAVSGKTERETRALASSFIKSPRGPGAASLPQPISVFSLHLAVVNAIPRAANSRKCRTIPLDYREFPREVEPVEYHRSLSSRWRLLRWLLLGGDSRKKLVTLARLMHRSDGSS